MKISNRDKILISFFICFLIGAAYYNFTYKTKINEINNLMAQKQEYQAKIDYINNCVASIGQKEKNIKIVNAKIKDKTINLFPEIKEEKVIVDLDKILTSSKLDGVSMGFSGIGLKAVGNTVQSTENNDKQSNVKSPLQGLVDEYNSIDNNNINSNTADNQTSSKKETANANNMTVNINYTGNYSELLSFIQQIEKYSKKIIVSNVTVSQGDNSGVSGTIALDLYGIPKISDEDAAFLKWNIKNPYGKDNPFDDLSAGINSNISNTNDTIEEIGQNKNQDKFDFVMVARPINSDLPTIMLGKANDKSKETYVYADNGSVENVSITFTQKDGKYYYKYITSGGQYPTQSDGKEFTTIGKNIVFKIYSTKRNSNKDVSGAKITITNKTDKQVNVNIEDDDNTRPRINITGQGGNVNVSRN